jgi:hypothetical protein
MPIPADRNDLAPHPNWAKATAGQTMGTPRHRTSYGCRSAIPILTSVRVFRNCRFQRSRISVICSSGSAHIMLMSVSDEESAVFPGILKPRIPGSRIETTA